MFKCTFEIVHMKAIDISREANSTMNYTSEWGVAFHLKFAQ